MERYRPEYTAETKPIYDTLRGLLDSHIKKLPADVACTVSSVAFAFYTHEARVHALRIDNPHSRGDLEIALFNTTQDTFARYTLRQTGEMTLEGSSTSSAANPAYASVSEPFGAELGSDLIDNFAYYAPLLDRARVTATIEL